MRASELRIGNWVDNAGTPRQIEDAEELLDVETFKQFGTYSPLPLTSEWLERFGFALVKESPFEGLKMKYWVNNRVCLFFNESEPFNTYLLGFADQRFGKYSVVTGDWIYHVHTLQNAFYAFTGTELTIKE